MSSWPVTLPQKYDLGSYNETMKPGIIRVKTDIGPGKTRRRFTAAAQILTGSMTLTTAQLATFETFFMTTTNGGADPFDWTHPRTGVAITAQFYEAPEIQDEEGGGGVVSFAVEVLP
jgi:hypothetical protein